MKKLLAVLYATALASFIGWMAYDGWSGSYPDFLNAACAYVLIRAASKLYNQFTFK